jgi:hypothetical protein
MTSSWNLRLSLAVALGLSGAPIAHAQTRVGGGALALSVHVDNLATVEPNPQVVLPDEGGSTEAHLLSVALPGVVSTATLTAESTGTVGLANATTEGEGRIEGLNLLNGLVTADLLVAHANATSNGVTATSSAAGSQFVNLVVAGIPIALNPPPNLTIPIPGVGSVIINEQVVSGNGANTRALTVNAIRVVMNGLLQGEAIAGSATAEVEVNPPSNPCACPADDDTVSGEAHGAFVDVLDIDLSRNPDAILSAQGGSAQGQALGLNVATLLSSGTVTSTTAGSITPNLATSQSVSVVEQLDLLNGVITADAVQAQVQCAGNGTTANCSAAGSTLANLRVAALVLNLVPPPNTVIPLPLIGSLRLNEQITTGNGVTTRAMTVNLIHVNLNGILGTGDIIVASARAGVDFDPPSGCVNVCDDGNPCNGLETCDPQTGCQAGSVLDCSDGNACNGTETCDPTLGCQPAQGPSCDDNDPCNGVETCDAQGGCHPGAPPFMADVDLKVKDGARIEGDAGANAAGGRVNFGKGNFMADGATLFGDRVMLGNATSVFNVRANNFVSGQDVVIRGATGPVTVPLIANFCPVPAFQPCGGNDLLVPAAGVTGPIAPGTYRNARIPNGATLVLSPGAYRFCSLTAGRNTAIRTTGAGATTIDVHGSIKIGNNSSFGPDAGSPRPAVNSGGHQVRLGAGTIMDAALSAPDAAMSMGRAAIMDGTFCVNRLRTDHSIVLQGP